MEQAVNLFTKCLLMDTSPMVLGNDTLTDVLNGTFVTMNGNEIILLNDMGNRRVADAYLPAGFEPVGIKEYGGIIYVAAYNPITNLSQIGSFPSPLRKYSNDDGEVDISLNYLDNIYFKLIDINGPSYPEKFLVNDFYLKKLINTYYVPGDKFITVCDYYEDSNKIHFTSYTYNTLSGEGILLIGNEIHVGSSIHRKVNIIDSSDPNIEPNYNYYTIFPLESLTCSLYDETGNALGISLVLDKDEFNLITTEKDSQNKLFSLYYGIINSQNLFIDITNTLKTLESTNHFLAKADDTTVTSWENLTSDDKNLEQNRQTWDMNTYSGKLVGYPYIRVLLNHPVSFRYSYTGKRIKRQKLDKNNKPVFDDNHNPVFEEIIKLKIVATIEYNCPDFKDDKNVMIPRSNKTDIYDLNKDYKNSYGFSLYRSNYSTDEESTTNEESIINGESTTDGESTTTNGE